MFYFPRIVVLSPRIIDEIEKLRYSEESFRKFDDPTHPQYADYKDRHFEKWHDQGHNNAIDDVVRLLRHRRRIFMKLRHYTIILLILAPLWYFYFLWPNFKECEKQTGSWRSCTQWLIR